MEVKGPCIVDKETALVIQIQVASGNTFPSESQTYECLMRGIVGADRPKSEREGIERREVSPGRSEVIVYNDGDTEFIQRLIHNADAESIGFTFGPSDFQSLAAQASIGRRDIYIGADGPRIRNEFSPLQLKVIGVKSDSRPLEMCSLLLRSCAAAGRKTPYLPPSIATASEIT